jgi:hypothetical protein
VSDIPLTPFVLPTGPDGQDDLTLQHGRRYLVTAPGLRMRGIFDARTSTRRQYVFLGLFAGDRFTVDPLSVRVHVEPA